MPLTHLNINSCKSFYLDYLFGLNYWGTNTLFIFIIVSIFFYKFFRVFSVFSMNLCIKTKTIPLLLTNKQMPNALFFGTIVIHPILYYLFTVIFVLKFFKATFKNSPVIVPVTKLSLSNALIVTLLLGGLWGLQSTVWGYFWVNDSVEWLLLLLIVYTLIKIHTFSNLQLTLNKFNLILTLLNLVLIVRLNLLQTRHSFIEQQSLIFVIMLIYYFLSQTAVKSFPRQASYTDLSTNYNLFTIVFLALPPFVWWGTLLLKHVFVLVSVFFVNRLRPGFISSKVYSHILFISFFFAWNTYFTFFFLFYQKIQIVIVDLPKIFPNMFVTSQYISKKLNSFALLESVVFEASADFSRQFKLVYNTVLHIKLSNIYMLVFLIFFFVKLVEFRLLYATETPF